MALEEEQIEQIKEQLLSQIESFPEDKRAAARKQVEAMNAEELEEFLVQNNLIKNSSENSNQKCVFCSIIYGEIPSTKIAENEKAIAVLELNPISKAHTLIVPKEHITKKEDIPKEAEQLAKQISKKIQKTFNPKKFKQKPFEVLGHWIISLIPIYKDETFDSPRKKSTPEKLAEIQKQLNETEELENEEKSEDEEQEEQEIKPKKTKQHKEEINEKNTWLPIRIP